MTDEIKYFAVNDFKSVTAQSLWDGTGRAREIAFDFFHSQSDEIINALGISFDDTPFFDTTLRIPICDANNFAKERGLPYRFIIELRTFEEDIVDAFLAASD